jgi:hypothetical protein
MDVYHLRKVTQYGSICKRMMVICDGKRKVGEKVRSGGLGKHHPAEKPEKNGPPFGKAAHK